LRLGVLRYLPLVHARRTLFGATDVVDASMTDDVEAMRELSGGGVNRALEVIGIAPTIEQACAMLDTWGTATVVGAARPEVEVKLRAGEFLREKRLQGWVMGSARFRLHIPLYAQLNLDGQLKLDELLSERLPLKGVNATLDQLDNTPVARAVVAP
jgi:S-(hydroxymethyl)glutathione dehydrogenase/alcohol dehydrogenase